MTAAQRVSYVVKVVVAHALYYAGVLQLWQAVVLRRKAVVLMYHRVLTADERARTGSHPALVVDRDTFAQQMAVLKRRFSVLSAHEFARCMEQQVPFPDSSCLITFDDGWLDNFTNALPVLRQHGLPAVVFLPFNYIGERRLFWQEALTHLLMRAIAEAQRDPESRSGLEAVLRRSGLDALLDVPDGADRRARVIDAVARQKSLGRAAVQELVDSLARQLGTPVEELSDIDAFISWEQADVMLKHGVAFGGHGIEHLLLTQVAPECADAEIRGSRRLLERKLGQQVSTFSYPNGYVTPEIAGIAREAGYTLGFITDRGHVSATDDRFMVRRLNVHEGATSSTPMFLARVVGLW